MAAQDTRRSIELTLASHTNVGKTALLRTLLASDVGEVRDEEHVTQFSERHTWVQTADGCALRLWDTPGFGNSARLLQRMRQSGTPLGWLLSQLWDRWVNPGFYFSQLALRTVQEQSDVVLYLVNAAESPQGSAYVECELQILAWTGKPVIALVNQLGTQLPAEEEAAEVARWEEYLARFGHVRRVLALDAFARCWVQEFALHDAVLDALPDAGARALMARLAAELRNRQLQVFARCIDHLSRCMAQCAVDRELLAATNGRLRALLGEALRVARPPARAERAARALEERARKRTAQVLRQLIDAHRLDARLLDDTVEALQASGQSGSRRNGRLITGASSVAAGLVGGLLADLASGGLTLGIGAAIGALGGLLGGRVAAVAYERKTGAGQSWVEWQAGSLEDLLARLVMAYLVVAHAGRARGEVTLQREHPRWSALVPRLLESYREALDAAWQARHRRAPGTGAEDQMYDQLLPIVDGVCRDALATLYPDAAGQLKSPLAGASR